MISETKIKSILRKLNNVFEGEYFGTYEAKGYLEGTYAEIFNRLTYMEGHSFLNKKMVNGSQKFCITGKGFKFIEKTDEVEKGVDKVTNTKKGTLTEIREKRIMDYMNVEQATDKFKIHNHLSSFENISPDNVYQVLRGLVKKGELEMWKQGKGPKSKNMYGLPDTTRKSPKELEKEAVKVTKEAIEEAWKIKGLKDDPIIPEMDNSVKVHEVNTTSQGKPLPGPTIGSILDLVWPYSSSAECRKSSNLVNQNHDSILARFKDQKTLLTVFNSLPEPLQDMTKITIEPHNKKMQLYIPLAVE